MNETSHNFSPIEVNEDLIGKTCKIISHIDCEYLFSLCTVISYERPQCSSVQIDFDEMLYDKNRLFVICVLLADGNLYHCTQWCLELV